MANEEIIGFHKGAISTLIKERQELAKMVSIVDQLLSMHLKALKDLGVDIAAEAKKVEQAEKPKKTKKK
jgi:hypothetical protein